MAHSRNARAPDENSRINVLMSDALAQTARGRRIPSTGELRFVAQLSQLFNLLLPAISGRMLSWAAISDAFHLPSSRSQGCKASRGAMCLGPRSSPLVSESLRHTCVRCRLASDPSSSRITCTCACCCWQSVRRRPPSVSRFQAPSSRKQATFRHFVYLNRRAYLNTILRSSRC